MARMIIPGPFEEEGAVEHTVYLILAVVGCTLLVAQVVLQLFGLADGDDLGGADVDTDVDHGGDAGADGHGNWFFGVLSFKALTAFAGVFGLTGLILEEQSIHPGLRVAYAAGAGIVAMLAIARLMIAIASLHYSGTVDIRNAVGHTGTVYTRIPEANSGWGKVTVEVQGRTLELRAVTLGAELQSGTRVQVVSVAGDETLQVERI